MPSDQSDGDSGEFEVEKVLRMRYKKGHREFFVHWKGYNDSENSWEPEQNLIGCKSIVDDFLKENPDPKENKQRKSNSQSRRRRAPTDKGDSDPENEPSDNEKSDEEEFSPNKKGEKIKSEDKENQKNMNSSKKTPSKGGKEKSSLFKKKNDENRKSPTKALNSTSRQSRSAATNSSVVLSSQTNIERASARRQNLSNNMRWIVDSDSDSDDKDDDRNSEKSVDKPQNISSFDNIHPDSSTDPDKAKEKLGAEDKNQSINSDNNTSLKLKLSVSGGLLSGKDSLKRQNSDSSIHKERKHKKSKKHRSELSPPLSRDIAAEAKLTFLGGFRNNLTSDLSFVAIDSTSKKNEVFTLSEAHAADSWALCQFLASSVIFTNDGLISSQIPRKEK